MTSLKTTFLATVTALILIAECAPEGRVRAASATPSGPRKPMKPLSHNDSLRFKLYYYEAMQQQIKGNFDAAYDLYALCRDINPNAAEAWFMLSYYDILLKGDSAALADIKIAADLRPDNDDYLERLATGYIKNNDNENAIKAYERLASNNPERADILDILTQLYEQKKDYDGVLRAISREETLEGASEQTALAKMRVYALQGKKDKELAELQSLSARHPSDMNYKVMTGNWLLQNGRAQDAYTEYMEALKQEPDNAMARMSLIDYYRLTGDSLRADSIQTSMLVSPKTPVESKMSMMRQVVSDNEKNGADSSKVLQLFHKILAVEQETTDMAELYVAYMTLKKMPQDSINNALELILEQAPDNAGARIRLLEAVWNTQNYARVETLSRQALDYNADEPAFYYFLGLALVQQKRDSEALDVFRKCTSLDHTGGSADLIANCYAIIGDILHDQGKPEQAYAAYDSCLQLKDDNFGCLNNYAYYLSEENRQLGKAEQMSYRTVQAEPDNSTYLDTYAWILFKQEKYAEAAEYIDLAIKNDTTKSAVLLEHGGDIHAQNGNISAALKLWQQAIDAGSGNRKAILRKIKLKKYIHEK